jgi:hypothetical protein
MPIRASDAYWGRIVTARGSQIAIAEAASLGDGAPKRSSIESATFRPSLSARSAALLSSPQESSAALDSRLTMRLASRWCPRNTASWALASWRSLPIRFRASASIFRSARRSETWMCLTDRASWWTPFCRRRGRREHLAIPLYVDSPWSPSPFTRAHGAASVVSVRFLFGRRAMIRIPLPRARVLSFPATARRWCRRRSSVDVRDPEHRAPPRPVRPVPSPPTCRPPRDVVARIPELGMPSLALRTPPRVLPVTPRHGTRQNGATGVARHDKRETAVVG